MRAVIALFAVALALGLSGARAAPASAPQRLAILVGDWDYDLDNQFTKPIKAGFVSDLHNPCKDLELIKAELVKANFRIVDYCNVQQEDFTKKLQAFSTSLANLPKRSVVFVYFAGHGMQWHGYDFLIPVKFTWDSEKVRTLADEARLQFFREHANEVGALLRKLPTDPDVKVVIALDNCRDDPFGEETAFNEAVSIRTPANAAVLYATTAGDTTSDGSARGSDFALELARQLATGRDVGDILSNVNVRLYQRFRKGSRDTYAELTTGPAFTALSNLPLRADEPPPPPPTSRGGTPNDKIIVRNVHDGMSLDILWCQGPGEVERFRYASGLANRLKDRANQFKVGRIQLKPLSEDKNAHDNYGVYRNLMRYDADPKEREVLLDIAEAFPEASFLPARGVGVGGHPTLNYVSAFICGRVPSL